MAALHLDPKVSGKRVQAVAPQSRKEEPAQPHSTQLLKLGDFSSCRQQFFSDDPPVESYIMDHKDTTFEAFANLVGHSLEVGRHGDHPVRDAR